MLVPEFCSEPLTGRACNPSTLLAEVLLRIRPIVGKALAQAKKVGEELETIAVVDEHPNCSGSLEGKMASAFDRKADDWNIAAHVMLKKTPENLSGVAFKFGSPSIRVAAQVSLLGKVSGSSIPTSEDYARFVAVSLRNFTSNPFSIHDLQGLRGTVELSAESMFPIALQRGSTLLFFNAEIDMSGNSNQFVISGQWIIRKVLNYSQTWT